MPSKLTVLIPCKNEQSNIADCIASVRNIADEILVADSGSTDATLDLVRQVGSCRIIEREFTNYAHFKNWAIPKATHPWVLIVDADGRVPIQLAEEIRKTLQSASPLDDAYWISRRTFFLGHELRYSGVQRDRVCRLIRRDLCRYSACRVHEEIDLESLRAGHLSNKIDHFSHRCYEHRR